MAKGFSKLSRQAIRRLTVGACITENGITYQRLAGGDGVYSVNVMVDGQRIHRVIGRESEGTTRTQAEEFIAKVRHQAREGRLALPKGRKLVLTFKQAAEQYLARLEVSGGRDLANKRRRLQHHLVPFFGSKPLASLTSFDLERYKKHRLTQPAVRGRLADEGDVDRPTTKPGTVNRELAALSHLLNMAVEWGWVTHRPVKIGRLREGEGRLVYLTVEQSRSLLHAAKADDNPQVYPFIRIALGTSMRRSEILSLRQQDIDLERALIHIRRAKAGAREQPMTGDLVEYLRAFLSGIPCDQVWLFPSPTSATGYTRDIRKAFRRAVAAAGLDPDQVVRHTLRHTAITHLVQAGVDLPTVKRISGHKTLAMVERYSHQNGAHIREAMEKLQDRLMAA